MLLYCYQASDSIANDKQKQQQEMLSFRFVAATNERKG